MTKINQIRHLREIYNQSIPKGVKIISSGTLSKFIRKRIAVFGGIHGNERLGINVVRELVKRNLELSEGTELVLVEGNPRAIRQNSRTSSETDLNRCFTQSLFTKKQLTGIESYEEKRAFELKPILENSDFIIDLHATNLPSDPFVRVGSFCFERHLELASWFRNLATVKGRLKLLLDNKYVLGDSIASTDEYANFLGSTAICVETGEASDLSREQTVFDNCVNAIDYALNGKNYSESSGPFEKLEGKNVAVPIIYRQQFRAFKLLYSYKPETDNFRFKDDVSNFQVVQYESKDRLESDLIVGYDGDKPVSVKRYRYLVFPKIPSLIKKGKPAFYVAKIAAPYFDSRKIEPDRLLDESKPISKIKYKNLLRRVAKYNRDSFMHFIWDRPSELYKKSGKSKVKFITDDNSTAIDNLHNFEAFYSREQAAKVDKPVAYNSFEFGLYWNRYIQYLNKAEQPGKKRAEESFLYKYGGEEYLIYPTTYKATDSHYAKGVPPYSSPILVADLKFDSQVSDNEIIFTVSDKDVREKLTKDSIQSTVSEIFAKVVKNLHPDTNYDCTENSLSLFISVESEVSMNVEEKQEGLVNVYFEGLLKDEVGSSFVQVLKVFEGFSQALNRSMYLLYPTFSSEGLLQTRHGKRKVIYQQQQDQ